ncbi:uncharacterized protein BXIN_1579 [Babesia sp. Xinjiang]|uniref:uncharacterized protein n=1 Tax=Babesia sp. Xinjiang TaxID=462227 RepID=UPI000A2497A6|nr:uncharacterized protein BXIN_1579 [Babesia sp. Xinjiang]ORM42391.1 hypothetical protein BXIN_1579 [Babesia sp. Xinjiang]
MNIVPVWVLIHHIIARYAQITALLSLIIPADGFKTFRNTTIKVVLRNHKMQLASAQDQSQDTHFIENQDVARRLEKERAEKVTQYLAPMETGLSPGLDEKEIIKTFGEPYSPEYVKKREERNKRLSAAHPPVVPPTNKLPYFVNMQNPKNPLGEKEVNDAYKALMEAESEATTEEHDELNQTKIEGQKDNQNSIEATNNEIDNVKQQEHTRVVDLRQYNASRFALLQDDHHAGPFIGDPLDPYFEASARQAFNDDEQDEEEQEEQEESVAKEPEKKVWYLDKPLKHLLPKEMADGWSILPGGRIYKHLLRPSDLPPQEQRHPQQETYVSFGYKVADAFTGHIILEAADMNSDGMIMQLKGLSTPLQQMIASMVAEEQAEFIIHASEVGMINPKYEDLKHIEWVRIWLHLIMMHERGEKWWHLSPLEASKYPKADPDDGKLTKMERLNLKTEEITRQVELELENNPCSPLWEDVMHRLTEQQKASVVEHFDRKYEMQQRQRCAEYSGSRGFADAIKTTGQMKGYDLGRVYGGTGAFYTWKETPFVMYVAVPVVPGIRAEHVHFNLEPNHMLLKVAGKTTTLSQIIDDDIKGAVETGIASSWAMSEKAMEYDPLPPDHQELQDPVLKTSMEDEYHTVVKEPSIIIALTKRDKAMGNWGVPFVNI